MRQRHTTFMPPGVVGDCHRRANQGQAPSAHRSVGAVDRAAVPLARDRAALRSGGEQANADRYRKAAWLVRGHAVTVLPSVASLRALRTQRRGKDGWKAASQRSAIRSSGPNNRLTAKDAAAGGAASSPAPPPNLSPGAQCATVRSLASRCRGSKRPPKQAGIDF